MLAGLAPVPTGLLSRLWQIPFLDRFSQKAIYLLVKGSLEYYGIQLLYLGFYSVIMQQYDKVQRIADSITEAEYASYRNYFQSILNEQGSEGFTVLKHLKKLPHPTVPGEFVYEYQLSDGLARFFVYMEQEFKGRNQDLKSAITLKILDELYIKPTFTKQ
jgi:hypothetical protein